MKMRLATLVASLLLVPLADAAPASPAAGGSAAHAATRTPLPQALAAVVGSAPAIGDGPIQAWRVGPRTLLAIPVDLMDRLFFWYVEAARFPTSAVAIGGNSIAEAVVTLERRDGRLLVRDRTPAFQKRAASDVPTTAGAGDNAPRGVDPINRAIDAASLGPTVAVLPIVAEGGGRLLVDLTGTFANDIDGLTASRHIVSAGYLPAPIGLTVDAARSYIADVDVYPDNVHIRSHLTFRATDPSAPTKGFQPVSIEVGHSLIMLPEQPMPARRYDDRVGFFFTNFTEYETASGEASSSPLRGVIKRFRLEKKDPAAKVSDPVKPIVFYIGQGVPDRWRPYIARAIESWEPVFRAAGFSNAIVARNAPTPAEDPRWSPEDARYNVIRWVPQAFANAQGPSVIDPRSGEVLFAHVLLWPDVLNFFSNYYWLMARGIDTGVAGLPLTEQKQGELLTYIVAHEVGHSIGLRHNHLASTAYSVRELRDPAIANSQGPNASIMAYGRMNQAAQPGDGVTRLLPTQGAYDFFAIDWGYGVHGATPAEEQAELDRLAAAASRDRLRRWGAGEAGFEDKWANDPRVQMENTGAERIEATRLGLRKVSASVEALDSATADEARYRAAYGQALVNFDLMLGSVVKVVGGQLAGEGPGGRPAIVPPAEQRDAVRYLLGEGVASYDVFQRPAIALRANPNSADLTIDAHRARALRQLLSGPKLAQLQSQQQLDPKAYGVRNLADDVTATLWSSLVGQPAWRAALQGVYLDEVERMLAGGDDPNAGKLAAALNAEMYSPGYIVNQVATASETVLPAYARLALPLLQRDLQRAIGAEKDPDARLRLVKLDLRIARLLRE